MKRLSTLLIALFMLFAISESFAQGKSVGKGLAHDKVAVCHKGKVIFVNSASLVGHLAHGDQLAVQNIFGMWVCPCEPEGTPPAPRVCKDGTVLEPRWDSNICEWVLEECNCDEPNKDIPFLLGEPYEWKWNAELCSWIAYNRITGNPLRCGTVVANGQLLKCNCIAPDGTYILCP